MQSGNLIFHFNLILALRMSGLSLKVLTVILNVVGVLPFTFDNCQKRFRIQHSWRILSLFFLLFEEIVTFRVVRVYISSGSSDSLIRHLVWVDSSLWIAIITVFFCEKFFNFKSYLKVANNLVALGNCSRLYSFNRLNRHFWCRFNRFAAILLVLLLMFSVIHATHCYKCNECFVENLLFASFVAKTTYYSSLIEVSYFYKIGLYFDFLTGKLQKRVLLPDEVREIIGLFYKCWDVMRQVGRLYGFLKLVQIAFAFLMLTAYFFYIYYHIVYSTQFNPMVGTIPLVCFWLFQLLVLMPTNHFWKSTINQVSVS